VLCANIFSSLQVTKEKIDEFQAILDGCESLEMPGIMKTHHVFTFQDKILYRSLSCHCKGFSDVCQDCFHPSIVRTGLTLQHRKDNQQQVLLPPQDESQLQLVASGDWVTVVYGSKWFIGEVKESVPSGKK
jgi:hypothetical protein